MRREFSDLSLQLLAVQLGTVLWNKLDSDSLKWLEKNGAFVGARRTVFVLGVGYRLYMTKIETSEPKANVIAVFGSGALVKAQSGKLELQGGTNADFIEARDWASMFAAELIVCRSARFTH